MANNRLSMRKITEALRLHYECGQGRKANFCPYWRIDTGSDMYKPA